jgi:hypothetical protein
LNCGGIAAAFGDLPGNGLLATHRVDGHDASLRNDSSTASVSIFSPGFASQFTMPSILTRVEKTCFNQSYLKQSSFRAGAGLFCFTTLKRITMKIISAILFALLTLSSVLCAGEDVRTIYVNNQIGDDKFDGLAAAPGDDGKVGPFKSIGMAFARAQTSCRIEIANTGLPYPGGNTLHKAGGTAEQPLIIDGHGATISGLAVVPADKWTKLDNGFRETDFYPMSNFLKGYKEIQCWIGTPQIWWLSDEAAPNCKNEEELKNTPGGFYWNKPLKKLWVNLPEGKTTDDIKIPVYGTSICINTDYVVVKNLRSIHSENDGFDTHGTGKNITFKHCIATDNCGQGFSVHDTTTAYYEDCLAERNASSGSCDVTVCTSIYKRCVFVNNSFEAGIYTTEHSQHTYEDCLIIGNEPFEQLWQRGLSKQMYVNCIIAGKPGSDKAILSLGEGTVRFDQCTLADCGVAAGLSEKSLGRLHLENCLLVRCSGSALDLSEASLKFVYLYSNVFWDTPGLRIGGKLLNAENWDDYKKLFPRDDNSKWLDPQLGGRLNVELPQDSPLLKAGLFSKKPARVGALLPDSVWQLYQSVRNDRATPGGVVKKTE